MPEHGHYRPGLFVSVDVLDSRIFAAPRAVIDEVAGHRIDRVARRGKVLILFLQDSGSLLIHPRMTGQLVVTVAGVTVLAGGHPDSEPAAADAQADDPRHYAAL